MADCIPHFTNTASSSAEMRRHHAAIRTRSREQALDFYVSRFDFCIVAADDRAEHPIAAGAEAFQHGAQQRWLAAEQPVDACDVEQQPVRRVHRRR
ncbi:hypothetical protein ACFOD4_20745 [Pseudoroseomonas globiformis]|uniref:Uncharacterized protein n=1 Tax=Teichococcus globiformis TaxID=2307229 RepID=A0ABV7G454_9PROT